MTMPDQNTVEHNEGMASMPGTFVGIVGPSGAGKDTLIGLARAALATEPKFIFPRRLVTRASTAWEDHDTLAQEEFDRLANSGQFALHWQANGLSYAIDRTILHKIEAGSIAICNISRTSIADARHAFTHLKIILITAPEAIIAARLAARGRDAPSDITQRLARNDYLALEGGADMTIINDTTPEEGSQKLIGYLHEAFKTSSAKVDRCTGLASL
jgi:ribose 1,5-bisphosphokinase